MEYPRTKIFRLDFALRRLAETVFLSWLMVAMVQQWILPHLENALETGQDHPEFLLHHVLAMAVPNNMIWLTFFICVFHSWLNFLGEILMTPFLRRRGGCLCMLANLAKTSKINILQYIGVNYTN